MKSAREPVDHDVRIVEVYAAANEVDAGAMQAALADAGIEARIVGDMIGNAFELPIGFREPKLWVREEDAETARQVIQGLQDQIGSETDDDSATGPIGADEV